MTIQAGDFFTEGNATVICDGVSFQGFEVTAVRWYSYLPRIGSLLDMGTCSLQEWNMRKALA